MLLLYVSADSHLVVRGFPTVEYPATRKQIPKRVATRIRKYPQNEKN